MPVIIPAQPTMQGEIFSLLTACRYHLDAQGIFQWMDSYPTPGIVEADISGGWLHVLVEGNDIIGAVCINDLQDAEYAAVPWLHTDSRPMVIHRLAVHPAQQGRGYARLLMDFAENKGSADGYTTVRLDAFSGNPRIQRFYEARGYEKRGQVFFPVRDLPFNCFEKML